MSTPSTATATLPHVNPQHRFPYHQSYRDNPAAYRQNNLVPVGGTRLAASYNYPNSPNSIIAPPAAAHSLSRTAEAIPPIQHKQVSQALSMPDSESSSQQQSRRRDGGRSAADWQKFYENGLPEEVIVIHSSSSPEVPNSVEPEPFQHPQRVMASSGTGSRQPVKKRKREDAYDPVYHVESGPGARRQYKEENSESKSTISTDRTTSAVQSTAATSLESKYSGSSRPYAADDVQPGQKRKRVATRQQLAAEAKRKENEVNGDAYMSYHRPPKPPIKAGEVNVKVLADNSYTKHSKVDDEDGHYIVVPDSDLTDNYQVEKLLGQGTFGKVVQARDKRRPNSLVAIKIIRSVQKYRDASRIELRVLQTLKANDRENRNRCIHLRECFDYRGHICIVMDLLGQSVFDFLKGNSFVPFPNSQIQSFARQLFTSVAFLHDLNLIHTDLKPENILLCESHYQTFTYNRKIPASSTQVNRQAGQRRVLLNTEIRLIDFGSATFQDEYHSSVVSTRHYRAPEIILGLGWSFPCDIWSIGCILVEFFTGDALFQTHDNLEHLAMMENVVDRKIDAHLIQQVNKMQGRNSTGANKYFKRLKLDYPQQDTQRASRRFVKAMKKLNDIIPSNNTFSRNFLDLLKRIFVYDPAERITALEALQHPWFKELAGPDDGTEALKIKAQRDADRLERQRSQAHYH